MAASLHGRRVLVVGASAGIGRAIATLAIRDGAEVIAAARRVDRLDTLKHEVGSCTTVGLDISDPIGFGALADAVAAAGALDLVVSTVGAAALRHLADTTPDHWAQLLRTNVSGFNELVRTVLPHLSRDAVVAALSSEAVDQPREALTAYAVTKAALEASIRGWRHEHPGRRFSCIRVGATYPTEFGNEFDFEQLGPLMDRWVNHGLMQQELMDTGHLAAVIVESLAVVVAHPGIGLEDMTLRSPSAVVGSAQPTIDHATSVAEVRDD